MGLVGVKEARAASERLKEIDRNKFLHLLSDEEKTKGYVRHYRDAYMHMGEVIDRDANGNLIGELFKRGEPNYPSFGEPIDSMNYVGYVKYPKGHKYVGWHLTEESLNAIENGEMHRRGACGKMSHLLPESAENFAKDHKFYHKAYCQHCKDEFSLSQFVWTDTDEIMGS